MQDEIDRQGKEMAVLHKELEDKRQARPKNELGVVAAARGLKAATRESAKESSAYVCRQRTGDVELACIDPAEEFEKAVPQLLRKYVDCLSRWGDEHEVDRELVSRRAGPKCLLAGVLTCWAHDRAWFKNANAMGIFFKENGVNREALDYLGKNLGIACADMSVWGLTQKVVEQVRGKTKVGTLTPRRDDFMAFSMDNINLKQPKHNGSNGVVDSIGGIG